MIMYDLHNTPSLDPVEMTDGDAVQVITEMILDCPVYARTFMAADEPDNVTIFWTVTPRGEVGTLWEHTRTDLFHTPPTEGDRAVEDLWILLTDPQYAQYDRDSEYATGE